MEWIAAIVVGAVIVLVIVMLARTAQRDRDATSDQQGGSTTITPRSLRTAKAGSAPSAAQLIQIKRMQSSRGLVREKGRLSRRGRLPSVVRRQDAPHGYSIAISPER